MKLILYYILSILFITWITIAPFLLLFIFYNPRLDNLLLERKENKTPYFLITFFGISIFIGIYKLTTVLFKNDETAFSIGCFCFFGYFFLLYKIEGWSQLKRKAKFEKAFTLFESKYEESNDFAKLSIVTNSMIKYEAYEKTVDFFQPNNIKRWGKYLSYKEYLEFYIIHNMLNCNDSFRKTWLGEKEKYICIMKWAKSFKEDTIYNRLRFKVLRTGYPRFDFDSNLLDSVNLDTFIRDEENRLPLFIGTTFGLYPNIKEIPGFSPEGKTVAILGKSLLTGQIAGLSIYQIPEDSNENKWNKIISFTNE